ncbi:ubiquinol-cytochrome c reductase cytochrome c1 subunit [Novosphingobium hassiacum]|uniref:Cytochrome c1 n=1 Tax=Novosphingobium hassiacum TaxID=173676 RepID=A0A7W6EUS0_9SPHN|nr:cytochrome c1 [Novosphingobium hassiacum]MBB3859472.1 ubiquinol-cytochrome c reductase cytochrome c1 subunit [Novosphingobium hassiacum]
MVRLFGPLVGLFFAVALLWSFGNGAYTAITEPAPVTAEHEFHLHPKELDLASNGAFGRFDKQQLQRGFQVYKEVCATCHSLKQIAFRDLKAIGYSDAEVKAIAKQWATKATTFNPVTGDRGERDNIASDRIPTVYYAGQGVPPDLSLMTKARHDGGAYVYSLLTGYQEQPAELLKKFPDSKTPDGLHYNPYFANLNLAMPAPITTDGQVTYSDGTKASVDQMSKDVSAFLVWTAEPKLDKRKQTGWAVLGFLLMATVLAYLAKKNVWADKH